jgi:hypothetical protein
MCVIRNHPYHCTDAWPWDPAGHVEAALATTPTPESWAAMSLTGGATATGPRERPGVPIGKKYRFDTAGGAAGGPG